MIASCLTVFIVVLESGLLFPITSDNWQQKGVPKEPVTYPTTDAKKSYEGSVVHSWLKLDGLATAFSTITLSFGGHAVIPSVEHGI